MSGSDLVWPPGRPRATAPGSGWSQARSNLCLDFHGDPANALVVFSDGNHHMALAECVEAFVRRSPGLHEVFYTTTPPSVYLAMLRTGELSLGNLNAAGAPERGDRGPRDVVERLHAERETGAPWRVRAQSRQRVSGPGGESEGDSRRGGSAPAGCGPVHVESQYRGRGLRSVSGDDTRDGEDSGA